MMYSSTPEADAAVEALRRFLRELLAKPGLTNEQCRSMAWCLAVLLDFPRVDHHRSASVCIGPYEPMADSGRLSLSLTISTEPGCIEATVNGSFWASPQNMHDSLTMCELTAFRGEAAYEDYRGLHASVIGLLDDAGTVFDEESLGGLLRKHPAPTIEVFVSEDTGDGQDPDLAGPPDESPWILRGDDSVTAHDWCRDVDLARLSESVPHVRTLSLVNTEVTDEGIAALDVPHLIALDVSLTAITDNGVRRMRVLGNLESLGLSLTGITDEALQVVATCDRMTELHLHGTRVSAAGIAGLARLSSLRAIDVSETVDHGDALARALVGIGGLAIVRIDASHLSGDGLIALSGISTLRELYAGANPLFDPDVHVLERMTALRVVDLAGTMISDAGVEALIRCSHLNSLDVTDTGITETGFAELSRRMPACNVIWRPPQRRPLPGPNDGDIPF